MIDKNNIYKVIISVLSGEASDEETSLLTKWLEESNANRVEFEKVKQLYTSLCMSRKAEKYDVDLAWEKIHPKLQNRKKTLLIRSSLKYAMLILIVISISVYFLYDPIEKQEVYSEVLTIDSVKVKPSQPTLYLDNGEEITLSDRSFTLEKNDITIRNEENSKLVYEEKTDGKDEKNIVNSHLVIPKNTTYQLVLSDGTQVWLNSETELYYPSQFIGQSREVRLIGEAFFDVASDGGKPFIVSTDDLSVKVLGTSFNISCYREEPIVNTTLVNGLVSIQTKNGKSTELLPSEQFAYNKDTDLTTKEIVDTDLYTSWTIGKYIFKNTSLREIITKLQRWHDLSIVFEDESLIDKRFTFTVDRETAIDQLLEVLSFTSEIKFSKKDSVIFVKKERR